MARYFLTLAQTNFSTLSKPVFFCIVRFHVECNLECKEGGFLRGGLNESPPVNCREVDALRLIVGSSFFNQEAFLQFGQSELLHVRPGVCGRVILVVVVFLLGRDRHEQEKGRQPSHPEGTDTPGTYPGRSGRGWFASQSIIDLPHLLGSVMGNLSADFFEDV